MTQFPEGGASLAALRQRIDALDAELHTLLMERARVIEGIVAAKRASGAAGPVFRPDREADMMRQLVERHDSDLPILTIEHLWREIITSCTGLQAPFTVHLDGSADLLGLLDVARFYFGFSTGLEVAGDQADVVGIVAASPNDLGLIALTDRADLPWWRGLTETGARIIARVPYLMMEDRPADLPALVIGRPVPVETVLETHVYDARWAGALPGRLMDQGIEVLSFHRSHQGVDALLAVSAELPDTAVFELCELAGAEPDVLRRVGGYAAPIDVEGEADEEFDETAQTASEGL
ncbi:chorismate mutase [Roseibium aquae]|nr:chorismate mutase [Roseibium aquae]